jgi:hypothetical protein
MRYITFILTLFILACAQQSFGQEQNLATVVDNTPKTFDIIFLSKLVVMSVLGIIAFISYLKYRKSN